jgi:hypothetical protein
MASSTGSGQDSIKGPTPNTLKGGVSKPNTPKGGISKPNLLKQGANVGGLLRNEGDTNGNQPNRANKAANQLANISKKQVEKIVKKQIKRLVIRAVVTSAPAWGIPALIFFIIVVVVVVILAITGQSTTSGADSKPGECSTVSGSRCLITGTSCASLNPAMVEDTSGLTCGSNMVCCLPTDSATPEPPTSGGTASKIFYLCQYGRVNASGSLIGPTWGGCSKNGFCTPTSVAMIMDSYIYTSYVKEPKYTPITVRNGGGLSGCLLEGSGPWDYLTYIKNNGYKVSNYLTSGGRISLSQVKNLLASGWYILAGAHVTWWQNSGTGNADRSHGHAFVISGISGNDLQVYDPTYCENGKSGGLRTLRDVNNLGIGSVGRGGWSFAIGIKKK